MPEKKQSYMLKIISHNLSSNHLIPSLPEIAWMQLLFIEMMMRRNERHFADVIFNCIFVDANYFLLVDISLKFVSKGLINSMQALCERVAWCQTSNKPLHIYIYIDEWSYLFHPDTNIAEQ